MKRSTWSTMCSWSPVRNLSHGVQVGFCQKYTQRPKSWGTVTETGQTIGCRLSAKVNYWLNARFHGWKLPRRRTASATSLPIKWRSLSLWSRCHDPSIKQTTCQESTACSSAHYRHLKHYSRLCLYQCTCVYCGNTYCFKRLTDFTVGS